MVDLTPIPVMKNGTFFGYADARQIAASDGVLEVYDERKAETIKAQAKVEAAKLEAQVKKTKIEQAIEAGGADAAAVKKGPASK